MELEMDKKPVEKKDVVRITYKLVKKEGGIKITKQSTREQKTSTKKSVPIPKKMDVEEDNDEDEDDLPLIKINFKAKNKKPASRKAIEKHKKTSAANNQQQNQTLATNTMPKKDEEPSVKVKPSYCKICFIKMPNDKEALEHERCHDTFRNPDGRWACIICSDQFPFYCDLLNHFLNHRDILELYSVYLSNLDTSLDMKNHEAYSDEESDELEMDLKDEADFGDENKEESNLITDNKNKTEGDRIVRSEDVNESSYTEAAVKHGNIKENDNILCTVTVKTEPNDEAHHQHDASAYEHYHDPDNSALFRNVSECLKLEAEGFTLKKELLDDSVFTEEADHAYDDGFNDNDSDEDKPLSSQIVKKHKKKKKKKKSEKENSELKIIKKNKKLKKKKLPESDECLSDEQTLKKHKKYLGSEERPKIPYSKFYRMQKCEECDFETSKKVDMETHSAIHVDGEPILCELCDFRCKIERQLLRHKRLVHEGYKFACDSCDFTSKTIANLRGHMVVHGERKIGCNICGKMFRRKNNLNDHLKTHTDDRPYKCPECPKTFKDPKGYKMHLLGAHNIVQRLTCGYCEFETDYRDELNMHKASLHHSLYMRLAPVRNENGQMVDSIIYACNMCEYIATTEANLKSHLIVHDEKRISCEVCGKLFRRLGNLLEHQRSHSENRPFVCPVCPAKAFKDNKSYRRHIARQHDMIEMIKCDICDYKTHTQGLMRFHAMKHSGQLRFKCNECSYACMTRNTMQRHKLVHKDVLPVYNCELCDFQSVSDRAVKRHKQVHAEK